MQSRFVIASFVLAACGSAADNTIIEATREQRIETIAQVACDKYDDCNAYGPNSAYQTANDCIIDYKSRASNMWPADKCSDGRMNDGRFQTCVDRVKVQACSQSFFDSVAALADCDDDNVCVDPAM